VSLPRTPFWSLTVAAALALPAVALQKSSGDPAKKEPRPAQSEVASTQSFGTVAASDSAVKGALAARDLEEAKKRIGKSGAFTGKVVKVFAPKSNSIVILNFAESYKDALTAVLRAPGFSRFPNMEELKGKKVLVTGTFSEFKGAPQIVLTQPSQVRIVE
jgi:hypothetical protein